jgi:uncharacterized iron-regulated membrane protein
MSLHKILLKLHLWTGLIAAIFLLILGVTGSILEWAPELDKVIAAGPQDHPLPISTLIESVQEVAPGAQVQQVLFGKRPWDPYVFIVSNPASRSGRRNYAVNPYTGAVIQSEGADGRSAFMFNVRRLHTTLMAGKPGSLIVNYATLLAVFLALSGLVLWWPRKIWKFKPGTSWWRVNFDLHNVAGIYSTLFVLVIACTGAMIHWRQIGNLIVRVSHEQAWRPGTIHSKPAPAFAKPLSLEQILARADQILPGRRTLAVAMAARPSDSVLVLRTRSDDSDSALKPQIFCSIDQYTGELLAVDDPSNRPWAVRLTSSVGSIHEGFFFGLTGRIIASFSSTAIPVSAITGFVIWWRRKMNERRRKVRAPAGVMAGAAAD